MVENKLAHEVDDKIVSFRGIVKQQLTDEVKDSVGETVKKEVKSHMSEEISDVCRTIEESTQRVADIRIANAEQEEIVQKEQYHSIQGARI